MSNKQASFASFFKLSTVAAGCSLITQLAFAAPVVGPAGNSFYTPSPVAQQGGIKGDLISYRATDVDLGESTAQADAWKLMYRSTDALGASNIVTGTMLTPTEPWTGSGERPVVSYAVGTHGLSLDCAPSKQLEQGTDYENANIAAALAAGYTVLVSDYAGYTNGSSPTYLAGISQGHAVLDIVKAAQQLPSNGISRTAPTGVWGYSQGGQSAAWAAQLQDSYAPTINLMGVAAGGIPGDFNVTAEYLNGNNGSSFLLAGVVGLAEQYPNDIPLDTLASQAGKNSIARAKTQCVFESLLDFQNTRLSDYTVGAKDLDQILRENPSAQDVLDAQNLGGARFDVPMYQYHGQADEFIPVGQAYDLKRDYCRRGNSVTFDLFPSEHIVTQFQAAPNALGWLGDRFNQEAIDDSCSSFRLTPTNTSNPVDGDFVVTLDEWQLNASILLDTLNQETILPEASTLTADANLTTGRLSGSLSVPEFKQRLSVLYIPTTVGLAITEAAPATGVVALSNDGELSIEGEATTDITITSVWGIPFGQCKTVEPMNFPLSFNGPVSALGSGNLTFTGETNFPRIRGCFISAILSTLVSGDGQEYNFNVTAPAPTRY